MIIKCPNCSTAFNIPDAKITPQGIHAKCYKCAKVFLVRREQSPAASGQPAATQTPLPAQEPARAAQTPTKPQVEPPPAGAEKKELPPEKPIPSAVNQPAPEAIKPTPEESSTTSNPFGVDDLVNDIDLDMEGEDNAPTEMEQESADAGRKPEEPVKEAPVHREPSRNSSAPKRLQTPLPSSGHEDAAAAHPRANTGSNPALRKSTPLPKTTQQTPPPRQMKTPLPKKNQSAPGPKPKAAVSATSSGGNWLICIPMIVVFTAGFIFLGDLVIYSGTRILKTTTNSFQIIEESRKIYKEKGAKGQSKLVIAGLVRNTSNTSKDHIKLRGRLYDKNSQDTVISEQEVYAGNLLSEEEVSSKSGKYFQTVAERKTGEANANVNIPGGFGVPFMIIFPDVPPIVGRTEVNLISSQ
jgi:predicted Zn finger-like uncharacterized protein